MTPTSTKITKPWGFEIILTPKGLPYTAKIAFTKKGHRWSLQYHDQKTETITLLHGQAVLIVGKNKNNLKKIPMKPNQGYTIIPNLIHRLEALSDSITIETSTPEIGNTVRLEDDYSRPTETQQIRNSPNRGWTQNEN